MQAVVEILLKGPWELGMRNVAWVHGRIVGVDAGDVLSGADNQFDGSIGLLVSGEQEQRVIITREFSFNLL